MKNQSSLPPSTTATAASNASPGSSKIVEAHRTSQRPTPSSFLPLPQTDNSRLHCFALHSAILPEPGSRQISVYLPDAYLAEPTRRFPVFYLHDGQNLFDPHTSYIPGRTWQAGATADRAIASGQVEPIILVGIANTGLRRMAEYTPTRDFRLGGGEGRSYSRLILNELKPFIDDRFRTLPGPKHTGVGGSSLGGLISLFLGLQYPETFGQLAVISPSIWWNHRAILTFVTQPRPHPAPRIWLDIGTAEGIRHVKDTELLHRLLLQQGWQEDRDLRLRIVEGAGHDEDAWAARFDQVLSFLFPSSSTH